MHWSKKYVIVGGAIAALAAGGAGTAIATSGNQDEGGATGPGADQAKAAALALYPGSQANAVERDSEDGATWEVEVQKQDGSTVDVRLDQNYKLVAAEADSEDQGGQ
jgi:uncharacterized membrane protein YkoI